MDFVNMSHLELLESHLQVNDKLQDAEHDRDALIEKCKRLQAKVEGYSQMEHKLRDAERDRDALIEKCKA